MTPSAAFYTRTRRDNGLTDLWIASMICWNMNSIAGPPGAWTGMKEGAGEVAAIAVSGTR